MLTLVKCPFLFCYATGKKEDKISNLSEVRTRVLFLFCVDAQSGGPNINYREGPLSF